VGPTAVGKSSLALKLAQSLNTEIISSDSRQMYRYLDIGTAKPDSEELSAIPHHFINTLNPDEPYNAARFETDAEAIIQKLLQNKDQVVVIGGSTLYMDALWYGFDEMPKIAPGTRKTLMAEHQTSGLAPLLEELQKVDPVTFQQIDQNNHARVMRALEVYRSTGTPISSYRKGKKHKTSSWNWVKIGLNDDRKKLYKRIDQRVLDMLDAGLEQEVKHLLEKFDAKAPGLQSIGYTEMIAYL